MLGLFSNLFGSVNLDYTLTRKQNITTLDVYRVGMSTE